MQPQMQLKEQVKQQAAPQIEAAPSSDHAATHGGVKNLAIAGAALSVMVLAAALLNQPSDDDFVEGTQISVGQTTYDEASLVNNGVGRSFMLRDFAMQDGDMVSIDGGELIPLAATAVAINIAPGALWLTFKNGTNGCASVEIVDTYGPRKLCVADGTTIATFAR